MTPPPPTSNRRRLLVVLAVAVAVLAASCSSGDGASDSPGTTASTAPPSPTAPSTAIAGVSPAPTTGPVLVSPFLLHDGSITKGATQQVEAPDGLNAALDALLAGPTPVDELAGLTTAVPRNAAVRSLSLEAGIATIDFTRPFETADTQPQVAQVVFTLTQVEGVTAVQFLIDGEPNGATGVKPLTRANFARYTPPVVVESPTPGATVVAPIWVAGTATPAGTTVAYRLEDTAGALIAEGSFVGGDDGTGGAPFAGTIDVSGYTGPAVLIMPAPDPNLDPASLTRVAITIS